MNRRSFLAATLGAAFAPGCSTPGVPLDVPYVATPWEVVTAMLRLAEVRPGDVVYDLGCGDGRIVIAAAKEFGARGVGIDIDPARIAEANAAARRAGVTDRVRFLQQDLFESDFTEATVVAIYLQPELNEKLMPRFKWELRPGTRIVSHEFGIRGWVPERSEVVWSGDMQKRVHLWVVPPQR